MVRADFVFIQTTITDISNICTIKYIICTLIKSEIKTKYNIYVLHFPFLLKIQSCNINNIMLFIVCILFMIKWFMFRWLLSWNYDNLSLFFIWCSSFIRFFRVIPAEEFLAQFSSDRRHMRRPDGTWIKPPPTYEPIQTMCEYLLMVSSFVFCLLRKHLNYNTFGFKRILSRMSF